MNKSILAITVLGISLSSMISACSTPSENVENAQTNVTEANQALDKANSDYLKDVEIYKKQSDDQIAANDKELADLRAKTETQKADAKADYRMKIAALEQKNIDMKKRMDGYKPDGKDKWEAFKKEFSQDMTGIGQAFKDLASKN